MDVQGSDRRATQSKKRGGRNEPLKKERPKWKSQYPMTEGQLRSSLTESYDELGNRYQLPVYTLSPPVNLITESPSETKGSASAQKQAQPPPCRQEFQLRVRLSTGKDVHMAASMADSIGQLKKQLEEQEDIDVSCQRWFFSGKLLTDKTHLQDTKIQKDFMVQVIVNTNTPVVAK
ncbi:hypothetical protein fugu_013056 [Takifugu bimaculatus]|uniref:Ubiquitin-like domain-containing protein n=1 Tax=Takifugu bimaculatus TaxID=433685 RepID=A0A4Z2C777_9TELE|nr:hypothetical protein fugu_013056 [Takifugu bimaculatus]